MSNLLLDERPLVVLPSLAEALGSVDKAIILQQLNYWVKKSNNYHDGRPWVYNSMDSWAKQFPWIKSKTTIKKHFKDLKKLGLVLTGNFNQYSFDRTTWYTIDYEAFEKFSNDFFDKTEKQEVAVQSIDQELVKEESKNDIHKGQKLANDNGQKLAKQYHRLPENTPETTTDIGMSAKSEENIPYRDIIEYLNKKAGKSFKYTTESHRMHIKAIWDNGFRLDDFKKVVDNKVSDWLGVTSRDGQDMTKYLRPRTLFSDKFEDYLNEQGKTSSAYDRPEYQNLFSEQWQPKNADDLPF